MIRENILSNEKFQQYHKPKKSKSKPKFIVDKDLMVEPPKKTPE